MLMVAGCGFFPSDPIPPSVAIRIDDGIVSVVLPCSPSDIELAEVYIPTPNVSDPVWVARGYLNSPTRIVSFDPNLWATVVGKYDVESEFGVSIVSTDYVNETEISNPSLAEHLPQGDYWVEGSVMSLDAFLALPSVTEACP
ncbi:hypothetical protein [Paraoerskovia sediminicola]|uniref:hypothetical protein n=1 Tax=Paraoerskovia sediminicola TaxID=1138587 RepID=UPI002572360F|nr:hypothetical protein [Paraoerskovia sediminicola]